MGTENRAARARRLRASDPVKWTYARLSAHLGVPPGTVYGWVNVERKRAAARRDNARPERKAAKRQWSRDHGRGTCPDCGGLMGVGTRGRGFKRCVRCSRAELVAGRLARDERILGLWRQGRSLVEIADELGSTRGSIGVAIVRMRREGVDVPYRRPRVTA